MHCRRDGKERENKKENDNLQLGILDGAVEAEGAEPVHLRGGLALVGVAKVAVPLQLYVHPAV
jgi:hypothetical protein